MGRLDIDYSLSYRGLYIEATFSPEVPATEVDPPDGGELQSLLWTVEDVDEVLGWLDYTQADELAQEFLEMGWLPRDLEATIDSTWDLQQVTTDHYHDA